MSRRNILGASCVALSLSGSWALAVNGLNGRPPAGNKYPYAGRVFYEYNASEHVLSGFMIGRGVAITSAHGIHTDSSFTDERHAMTFRLPGKDAAPALGVRHPDWANGTAVKDVGLLLLLNAPDAARYDPLMAVNDVLTPGTRFTGDPVEFAGFTGAAVNGDPLIGSSRLSEKTDDHLKFYGVRPNGTALPTFDFIEAGDSGGPTIKNYGTPQNPQYRIIGVHTRPEIDDRWTDNRVDIHLDFFAGKGVGNVSVINRINSNGGDWNTPANWNRTAAIAAAVPGDKDIVVLDPTFDPDAGKNVTVGAAGTKAIGGLLTDVNLTINGGGSINVAGFSGALNGGTFTVTGEGSRFVVAQSFDNYNRFNVVEKASAEIGAGIRTGPAGSAADLALYNASKGRIDVGAANAGNGVTATLRIRQRLENNGSLNLFKGGTVHIGQDMLILLDAIPLAVRNGRGDNAAAININAGGVLNVSNGAERAATILNGKHATIKLAGDKANLAVANVDRLQNGGTVDVQAKSNLDVKRRTINTQGGKILVAATMNSGIFTNEADASVEVRDGGTFTTGQRVVGDLTGDAKGFTNQTNALITIKPGGHGAITGSGSNPGQIVIEGANNKPARLSVSKEALGGGATKGKLFNEKGQVTLNNGFTPLHRGPAQQDNGAHLQFVDADFENDGDLLGSGLLLFTGDSSYVTRARMETSPSLNHQGIAVRFDAAYTDGGGPVGLEAVSVNRLLDPAGLDTPWAFDHLCIINGSVVSLLDDLPNESVLSDPTGGEVIYTYNFALDASSTIYLNGRHIYYQELDLACGGLSGTIIPGVDANGVPGTIQRIPEPAACGLLLLALAGGRRRDRIPA